MTLDEIYALCKGVNERLIDTFNESGGKEDTWQRQILNVAEETGEFVGAYRRAIGMARRPGEWSEVKKELADVVIASMVTAHAMGIDLPKAVRDKFIQNERRGYRETDDDQRFDDDRRIRVQPGRREVPVEDFECPFDNSYAPVSEGAVCMVPDCGCSGQPHP